VTEPVFTLCQSEQCSGFDLRPPEPKVESSTLSSRNISGLWFSFKASINSMVLGVIRFLNRLSHVVGIWVESPFKLEQKPEHGGGTEGNGV
jgi:hypothetical protein